MIELLPEPRVTPVKYEVSIVPATDKEAHYWSVTVEYRGDGKWAVCHNGMTMTKTGRWTWEPSGSRRGKGYLKAHRHDKDTALALAKVASRTVEINGLRVADMPAWRAKATAEWEAREAAHRAAARLQAEAREEAERHG